MGTKRNIVLLLFLFISTSFAGSGELYQNLFTSIDEYKKSDNEKLGKNYSDRGDISPYKMSEENERPVSIASVGCSSTDQVSIPYRMLDALVLGTKNGFDIVHDIKHDKLHFTFGPVVGTCSHLYTIVMTPVKIGDNRYNVLEARITKKYRANDPQYRNKSYYEAFLECLKDKRQGSNGEAFIDPETNQLNPNFDRHANVKTYSASINGYGKSTDGSSKKRNFYTDAEVTFGTRGSELVNNPLYGKINSSRGENCLFFEKVSSDGLVLYSKNSDEIKQYIAACQKGSIAEIKKSLDQLSDSTSMNSVKLFMQNVLSKLMQKKLKDTLTSMRNNNNIEELGNIVENNDMYVILDDFNEYVIEPTIKEIHEKYKQYKKTSSRKQKAELKKEIKKLRKSLESYGEKPLFTKEILRKLENAGKFEEAMLVFNIRSASNYSAVMTGPGGGPRPDQIAKRMKLAKKNYAHYIVGKAEVFNAKTGRELGKSGVFSRKAQQVKSSVQRNNFMLKQWQNREMKQLQKTCSHYWSRARCQRDVMSYQKRLQGMSHFMNQRNQKAYQESYKWEQRAQEFRGYESEGRRYLANQQGANGFGGNFDGFAPGGRTGSPYDQFYFGQNGNMLQGTLDPNGYSLGQPNTGLPGPQPMSPGNYSPYGVFPEQGFPYNNNSTNLLGGGGRQSMMGPNNYFNQQNQFQYRGGYPGTQNLNHNFVYPGFFNSGYPQIGQPHYR